MEANRKSVPAASSVKKKDVFQGFEYIPSEFNLVDVLKSEVSVGEECVLAAVFQRAAWCSGAPSIH